jgi:hypothetical protein
MSPAAMSLAGRRCARVAAALALAVGAAACAEPAPDVPLAIRLPTPPTPLLRSLLSAVDRVELRAERDGRTLAQRAFARTTPSVSLAGVPRGPRTVFTLEGISTGGDVIARGRTCPIDYEGRVDPVALYYAPANFFAPTVGAPLAARATPLAFALDGGEVLLAGGADEGGAVVPSTERFSPGASRFTIAPELAMLRPRRHAELALLADVGALVVGGVDASGSTVDEPELYLPLIGAFSALPANPRVRRVGHRATTLPDGRVLVTGGALREGDPPSATTALLRLQADGTAMIVDGPPLATARRAHAAVVAVGVPVVLGGYGPTGAPLDTLEALPPGGAAFVEIATLRAARAEATATVLDDGSILVAGGVDASGLPRDDAEVYNPITRTTTLHAMSAARRGHTATPIGGGRVLVVGGVGADGRPLSTVELFVPDVGFVSERPLGTARAGHVTVTLCDGTLLVVGGGAGAEVYTPPAR